MPKTAPYDTSSMSKKERIAFAREIAAMRREEARARRRRNRVVLIVSLVVGGLVVLGLAGLALWNQHEESLAGPENMLSDGIVFTSDGTTVTTADTGRIEAGSSAVATDVTAYAAYPYLVLYLDFADADSQKFWTANESSLNTWLTSGYIALEVHPLGASTEFSKLAANAAACVANSDPDSFLTVASALFTAGAADDASSRTADGVLAAVSGAGITDDAVLDCVRGDRFSAWVTDSAARAAASIPHSDVANAATLPVVLMDGTAYTGALDDSEAFLQFISDTYAAEQSTDTSTATPTPTPTPEATN